VKPSMERHAYFLIDKWIQLILIQIKLWDIRMRRPFCEMQSGHRNTSHKLPCFVDNNENFIFVVGEDAIIRGWSLHTGKVNFLK
jgi:hypothetical protein